MMLLTKSNLKKLVANFEANQKAIETDGNTIDFKPVVKLFNPTGVGTWYLTELDPVTNIAFGLCDLGSPELGYVSINELASVRVGFGLGIERDLHFKADKTLSEYAEEARNRGY